MHRKDSSHKKPFDNLDSDKLKTAFLQNISHEIRTPLNSIIGFSELLAEDDISREDIKKFTAIINQNGKRLIEIVNNIVEISKIQTGQADIVKKTFKIEPLLVEMKSYFTPYADVQNMTLNYHLPESQSRSLFSDEEKVKLILMKLIGNAIKFSKTANIDFGYEVQEKEIRFFVQDKGIGIAADRLERIFERFRKSDQLLLEVHEGAGLGLAICKGLIVLLGGRIWVESEVGTCTTFYFTLPLLKLTEDPISGQQEPEVVKKNAKGTILIAEDDWINYYYLKMVIEGSGITVLHAENGKQAVEMVMDFPDINLILMDINMPVMDGIQAARIIKQMRPKLMIIAHTTLTSDSPIDEERAFGCDDYLSKPIKDEQLSLILNKYLQRAEDLNRE